MGTVKRLLAAFVFLIVFMPTAAGAATQTSSELINKSKEYNGQTITYVGEAIGDLMKRGGHAWINVSDGSNTIGIWLTSEQAAMIENVGTYNVTGDTLKIIGVFDRACSEHGGDLDIHAASIEVLEAGSKREQSGEYGKAIVAFVLFAFAIAMVFVILKERM